MTQSTYRAELLGAFLSCIVIVSASDSLQAQVRPYQRDSSKLQSTYVTQPAQRPSTDRAPTQSEANRIYASMHGLGSRDWVSIFELAGPTGEVREALPGLLLTSQLALVSSDPVTSPAGENISGWHYKATYAEIGDIYFFFAENSNAFDPMDYQILWSFDDKNWNSHSHGFIASQPDPVAADQPNQTVEGKVSGLDVQKQNNGFTVFAFIGDTTAGVQVVTRDARFQSALEQASGNTAAIPPKLPRVEVTYNVVQGLNQIKRIRFLDR